MRSANATSVLCRPPWLDTYYATLTGFQAVKPSVVPKVLSDIVDDVDDKKIVVSIAAAVTIENIQSKLNGKSKVRNNQLLDVKQQDNFF